MYDKDNDVLIKSWVCGPLGVNCYLFGDKGTGEVVIIDPGGCDAELAEFVEQNSLKPKLIIATHGHLDHIMAIPDLCKRWGIEVACHPKDFSYFSIPDPYLEGFLGKRFTPMTPTHPLEDGAKIHVGKLTLEVIHTPGHTPGGICLLSPPFLFSGDTLFQAGIGRTDFPGGDYGALEHSLKERLWPLPDDLILLPGHGSPSRLGYEKGKVFI